LANNGVLYKISAVLNPDSLLVGIDWPNQGQSRR
jgi:hypothetical protein